MNVDQHRTWENTMSQTSTWIHLTTQKQGGWKQFGSLGFHLANKTTRGYSEDKTSFTHTHKHFRHCHTVNPGLTYGSNTISIKEKLAWKCIKIHPIQNVITPA